MVNKVFHFGRAGKRDTGIQQESGLSLARQALIFTAYPSMAGDGRQMALSTELRNFV